MNDSCLEKTPIENRTIICIDDDPHILDIYKKSLSKNEDPGFVDKIEITVEKRENGFKTSFADEGDGLPENMINEIFGKFVRADSTLKVKVKGTGLGLSVAKYIIEAHNGKIGAENSDSGAVFSFTLPFTQVNKSNV